MRATYIAKTTRSRALREAFRTVLPGGETRSVAYYEPYPIVVERGSGARIWDLDGNEYVDLLNNYTSLVHGHSHPEISEAISQAAHAGTVHPAPHVSQLALARLLVDRLPAVGQLRFTNSGSEAAILAARLARHVTCRRRIVLIDGGYHGTGSFFADPHPDVVRVPYNDREALGQAVDDTVAAVFVEPFLGSAGVIPADPDYLRAIQTRAKASGALFVLDEIQGLRSAVDGTHGKFALSPDLVLLGKIIGGGLPIGAVGGSEALLAEMAADLGPRLAHSGTFNGNVLSMVAGRIAMQLLDAAQIARLNELGGQLAAVIEKLGAQHGLPVSVTRAGSIMHIHFLEQPPADADQARRGDHQLSAALHLALLVEGVYIAPRGMLNLSTATTSANIDFVMEALDRALAAVSSHVGVSA